MKIKNNLFRNRKSRDIYGFSLVELLITVSIIGVLSVILVASFSNTQKNGRDQRRISDLKMIQNAAEQFNLLAGSYPPSASYRTTANSWTVNGQVILQKFPGDPQIMNGIGKTYSVYSTGATAYCVCAQMEVPARNSNAENDQCSFGNNGYFCIKNQQ